MNLINYLTYNTIRLIDKYIHQKKIIFYLYKILKKPKYILDIGAHNGTYSDLFMQYYTYSKFFLFEPNIDLYKKLKIKYKHKKNIKLYNYGIGDKNCLQRFALSKISDYVSTFSKINKKSKYLFIRNLLFGFLNNKINYKLVKLKKLDALPNIRRKKIDLIKVDVEGYEEKVIDGAFLTLQNTNIILIEYHKDDLYKNYKHNKIHKNLKKFNFKLYKKFKFPFMKWEDRIYVKKNYL